MSLPSSSTSPDRAALGHQLVHPVEDPDEGRLAAAGRADQRGHDPRLACAASSPSSTLWLPNQALTFCGAQVAGRGTGPPFSAGRLAPTTSGWAVAVSQIHRRASFSLRSGSLRADRSRAADQPGEAEQDQHQHDQHQRSRPGSCQRAAAAAAGTAATRTAAGSAVGSWNGLVFIDLGAERGHDQRRRLADGARDTEDDGRDQAAARGRQHHRPGRPPLRARPAPATPRAGRPGTSRSTSSAVRVTVGSIRIESASDAAKPEKVWWNCEDPDGVDEQPGDDRRHAAHRVHERAHRPASGGRLTSFM